MSKVGRGATNDMQISSSSLLIKIIGWIFNKQLTAKDFTGPCRKKRESFFYVLLLCLFR